MLGTSQAVLLGGAASLNQSYADTVRSLSPVAYWQLDEGDGSTIIDETEIIQNSTYLGSIEFGLEPIVSGSTGTSIGFNGADAYGKVPHRAKFATPEGTVAFAVQADSVSGQHMLLAKDGGSKPIGGLTVDITDGRLRAYLRNGARAAVWLPDPGGAADIQTDVAHHVALTWGGRGAELWLDGTRIASNAGLAVGLASNTVDLLIAAYPGPTAFGDVVMDEIAWFDRQLDPAQMRSLAKPSSIARPLPAAALPSAPATNAYWVDPIDGNDSVSASQARSATSAPSASPWKSLAKALAEWNAGNLAASGSGHIEIILRGGLSYERGNSLMITRSGNSGSHLVIKGYRDDISAGTRGGTGKYTGAKGRFVLRGNIEALETGGWEADPAAGGGRLIYRTSSTYTITGRARATGWGRRPST